MHYDNIRQLLDDERFRRIIRRKQRVPLFFSAALCSLFFGFVLVIAFAPSLLSMPLAGGGVITLHLVLSVILIVSICVLMNAFVAVRSKDRHDDIRELIASLREERR